MPISKKPRKESLDAFLSTQPPGGPEQNSEKIYHQQVRIEQRYIDQIDELCQQRRAKTPRHTWLLEAIFEKMDRELA